MAPEAILKTKRPQSSSDGLLGDLSLRIETKLTVPEQVTRALRDLILNGQLAPGAPVVESQIARELRIGQPTVREALKTLETEGLIQRSPNRGCTVVQLSSEDLEQVYLVRRQLEPLAVEQAMLRWSDEKAGTLRAAIGRMESAAAAGDAARYYEADLEFHKTLWALSGNRYLEKALLHVVLPIFAFFVTRLRTERGPRLGTDLGEHQAIVTAMLAGEGDAAIQALKKSLDNYKQNADLLPS